SRSRCCRATCSRAPDHSATCWRCTCCSTRSCSSRSCTRTIPTGFRSSSTEVASWSRISIRGCAATQSAGSAAAPLLNQRVARMRRYSISAGESVVAQQVDELRLLLARVALQAELLGARAQLVDGAVVVVFGLPAPTADLLRALGSGRVGDARGF